MTHEQLDTPENIEVAAVAMFTRHWQRKPDSRDEATGGLATYRTLASDVLAAVDRHRTDGYRTRFVLIPESVSQHCCFSWTIEDTEKTTEHGPDTLGGYFTTNETVCEGFDEAYGTMVLEALNRG